MASHVIKAARVRLSGAPVPEAPPVILIPGFLGPAFLLIPLMGYLQLHGRRVELLGNFPALDGVARLADRIAQTVDRLLVETGAEKVDLVAHSMGGLAARYYMTALGGAANVGRFVAIATPHRGTTWATMRFGQSMHDMAPESPLLASLDCDRPIAGVRCTNIRAGWDQIVWPREHGRWGDHVAEIEIALAEHWAIQLDPRTMGLVLGALES